MRGVIERRLRHRDRPKRSASDDSRGVCTRARACDPRAISGVNLAITGVRSNFRRRGPLLLLLIPLPLLSLNFAVRESWMQLNHRLHSHLLGSAVQLCRSSRSSRVIEHCERKVNSRFAVCPGSCGKTFRHCCPDAGTKFARAPKVLEAT